MEKKVKDVNGQVLNKYEPENNLRQLTGPKAQYFNVC